MFYILFLYLSICGKQNYFMNRILLFVIICSLLKSIHFTGELTNVVNAIPLNGEKIQSTTTQEFPFVASLQKKIPGKSDGKKHFCTGSLITTKDILSAAHCIVDKTTHDIQVVFGAINGKNLKYNVKWMVTYDIWAYSFKIPQKFTDNDVAILRVRLNTYLKKKKIQNFQSN